MNFAKIGLKWGLAAAGVLSAGRRSPGDPVVLCYHRVNDSCTQEMAVKTRDFSWQLEWLSQHANVITLDDALRIRESTGKRPRVVLTFDDGYRDFLDNAFPLLQRYNFPSLMYLVPGMIDGGGSYWWDRSGREKLLTWDEIRSLDKSGLVQFGSHSYSHHDLDGLPSYELAREVGYSAQRIAEETGAFPRHFSYPRDRRSDEAVEAARKVYASAAAVSRGEPLHSSEGSRWCFSRVPVQRTDGRQLWVARVTGRLWIEERLRIEVLDRVDRPRRNEPVHSAELQRKGGTV